MKRLLMLASLVVLGMAGGVRAGDEPLLQARLQTPGASAIGGQARAWAEEQPAAVSCCPLCGAVHTTGRLLCASVTTVGDAAVSTVRFTVKASKRFGQQTAGGVSAFWRRTKARFSCR
mgnify:CR=1 FL=1